ncbi:MAG: family 20 glycosylhydrolase [Acidobacteriota bacterium]|nr:MAG: family 20 glycosylhydrolase [Acidobacteriota bacterium]
MKRFAWLVLVAFLLTTGFTSQESPEGPFPVRGIHFMVPQPDSVPAFVDFIKGPLRSSGVNTLILELNYSYRYESHPELASENALSQKQLQDIVAACRDSGINFIPMINLMGHQSWAETTFALLSKYPEFDETPGKYPNNKDIYCRSYCPQHPGLHKILFALIDELISVTDATDFHAGMDEVFLIGEDDCPRCRGQNRAQLLADEIKRIHAHLAEKKVRMWLWGDRLIDGETTGIGEWEASTNDTFAAIDMIPTDIVICDWHYEYSPPTAGMFALKGFPVVMSPWRKSDVALAHLEQMKHLRSASNKTLADRALGLVHTTWTSPENFMAAYSGDPSARESATESAECFKKLFKKLQ